MKRIFLFVLLVLACSAVFGWDLVRQSAFPVNFYTIDLVGNHIWAGGSGGGVAKSNDEGLTWSFVPTPFFNAQTSTYRSIEDIDFCDENRGVIVGGMGIVAITADGGATWTYPASVQAVIGTTELKSCVYHASGKIWICGSSGVIAYSPDHGVSWSMQTNTLSTILYGMSMNEAGVGFIVCNKGTPDQSKILKTDNFGATWTVENLTVGSNPSIFNVRQFENKVVLVGDFGYLGYSDDNGATWTHHSYAAGTTTNDELHDVVMNGDVGYAVGWYHRIITTTDGWATYSLVSNDWSTTHIEGVVFDSNGNLVASGWLGTLCTSQDGAQTWNDRIPTAIDLWQASMVDANTWFIAGDKGNILKTDDGGQTLVKKKIVGFDDILYACHFFDENTGLVTGKSVGKIFRTTDGGDTWTDFTVPNFLSTRSYYEFFFLDANIGYVLGVGGKVAKTTDGGINWTLTGDNIANTYNLYCSYWKDEQTGYAGSGSGLLYLTTDGGVTWTSIAIGASANIRDIWFRDTNHGVLVKENGEIWYTLTGGNTVGAWLPATESAVSQINGVMCDHNGVWWTAGYSNETSQQGTSWALLKSLDGGTTWTQETLPAPTFNPTRLLHIGAKGGKIVAIGRNNVIYVQLEVPEHVTLLSPPNQATDLEPADVVLTWQASPYGSRPVYYQVFASTDPETIFDDIYYETTEENLPLGALINLDYGTTWYWAVLPVNEEMDSPDIDNPAFTVWSFSTLGILPGIPEPDITYSGNNIAVNWSAIDGASSYIILGCPTPYGDFTEIGRTSGTQFLYPNPGTRYFFKVQASTSR